jgi:hypothetical protein
VVGEEDLDVVLVGDMDLLNKEEVGVGEDGFDVVDELGEAY